MPNLHKCARAVRAITDHDHMRYLRFEIKQKITKLIRLLPHCSAIQRAFFIILFRQKFVCVNNSSNLNLSIERAHLIRRVKILKFVVIAQTIFNRSH